MPSPEAPRSDIEEVQHDRALADAIVQAGLSARMAYSLLAGMAGRARSQQIEQAAELLEEAKGDAERVKNADMALDHPIAGGDHDAEALRDAADTLEHAAEAYRSAARLEEAIASADGPDA